MKIEIFDQVEKVLRNETREVRLGLQDILEKLELGLILGLPHIRPLPNIYSGLFEIRV